MAGLDFHDLPEGWKVETTYRVTSPEGRVYTLGNVLNVYATVAEEEQAAQAQQEQAERARLQAAHQTINAVLRAHIHAFERLFDARADGRLVAKHAAEVERLTERIKGFPEEFGVEACRSHKRLVALVHSDTSELEKALVAA